MSVGRIQIIWLILDSQFVVFSFSEIQNDVCTSKRYTENDENNDLNNAMYIIRFVFR